MTTCTTTVHGDDLAFEFHLGTGTPLLLVHGVGSSTKTWSDVMQRLRGAGRTVVAIDLLGHGESGHGNGDFSLGANASRIRDLLDHLGMDRVHVVGHSLGGGVSLQFQYQYPERVESLTLISSGGLGEEVSAGLRAASLPGSEVVFRAMASDRVLGWLDGSAPPGWLRSFSDCRTNAAVARSWPQCAAWWVHKANWFEPPTSLARSPIPRRC